MWIWDWTESDVAMSFSEENESNAEQWSSSEHFTQHNIYHLVAVLPQTFHNITIVCDVIKGNRQTHIHTQDIPRIRLVKCGACPRDWKLNNSTLHSHVTCKRFYYKIFGVSNKIWRGGPELLYIAWNERLELISKGFLLLNFPPQKTFDTQKSEHL